jgi:hypothetical protein
MDDVALSIAALECGHGELLSLTPEAIAERVAETGRRLANGRLGGSYLAITADGVAGTDIVAAPVELSDHPLCIVGIVLRAVMRIGVAAPPAGAGPVGVDEISRELARRGRDGGHSLVGSLRALERLGLLTWDRTAQEVRVAAGLAAQPPSLFNALERSEPVDA